MLRYTVLSRAALVTAMAFAPTVLARAADTLTARSVLPATTFADGPTSGQLIGGPTVNGIPVPFINQQPVQGFSAILDNGDGTYLVMCDNGYGSLENSADFRLRCYTVKLNWGTARGGAGTVDVLGHIELHDPDHHVPFAITNHFSSDRPLTGADFDIESVRRAPDGSLWFGDEFGPFLIHTDADGKVLEAPIALPDFDNSGLEVRAPQNPLNEEASAVRIMNAMRSHALANGVTKTPVFSPWHVMLADGDPATFIGNRAAPPAGSGLAAASSEIFSISSLRNAGYDTVPYTINDSARMTALMQLNARGIISDNPQVLYATIAAYDANNDGVAGDYLLADGRINSAKVDAQGHRGARALRPENTLPAMEAALDNLMSTLETDCGITSDGIPLLDHDPHVQSSKVRRADGQPYEFKDEVLVKDYTLAEIQSTFIADKLLPSFPLQQNDTALSPVATAFATAQGLPHPYVMPSLQNLFDFVGFYATYYASGAGAGEPNAAVRAVNAQQVRFNIETKRNPRAKFVDRTVGSQAFVDAVAGDIHANNLVDRADVQSFDFSTLILVQEQHPAIRTVCLFGDFPIFDDPTVPGSDDGTNLQDEHGVNTPWLAGMVWPYRVTMLTQPFRAQGSGGFEGIAITTDGTTLRPMLEKPLVGGTPGTVLFHDFDLATKSYTGNRWSYVFEPLGVAIGDFHLFSANRGLVIERDNSQGILTALKRVYEVRFDAVGGVVAKGLAADLMQLADPALISLPALPGDVGLGNPFAFPFTTIENVIPVSESEILVVNDNNFPFSIGRHVGSGAPDDGEFIRVQLDQVLGTHTLIADLNDDGHVDATDLGLLLGAWGGGGPADFDGDGFVGASDLAILLGDWTM
ncbi:MAG: esterase-like activity of phytase family protein [Phycisphaerae bacterium]|nr:esterase-like activity of phytase family protein [Phycisphaerae bacterium]